jgi:IS4 transposase
LNQKTSPAWLTREALVALPEALVLREGRDHLGRPGFRTRQMTLATTRLEAKVSGLADLAEWSRRRWPVETWLAHLKTTMPMEVLPSQTVAGVLKELTVFALVDNLVRMVMRPSATRQHLAVERISVVDARRWLGAPSPGIP